jgi:putative transposase
MARPLRLHVPGAVYHIMSRGNNKQCIFEDDVDYLRYLELLERALRRFRVRCHAYCLLGNHFHLVLTPGEVPLSRMMQQLNSSYCQWFNRRHKRVGHVLQGRYKSLIVDNDEYFLRVIRYVTRNPVTAGIVELTGQWRWSSGPATLGLTAAPEFLDLTTIWKAFSTENPRELHERFAAFVETAGADDLKGTLLLGSPAFASRMDPILAGHRQNRDFVYAERFATRPPLLHVLTQGPEARFREQAAYAAFEHHAYTLAAIAEVFQRTPSAIWAWIQKVRPGRTSLLHLRLNELLAAEIPSS